MTVAIQIDMPFDVVDEMTQAVVIVLRTTERIEKPAEHLWDNVFAAVKECRQNLFHRAGLRNPHRIRNKGLHMGRRTDSLQGCVYRNADQDERAKPIKLNGAGANLCHGAEIKAQMADIRSIWSSIRLLTDHDVVNEAVRPRSLCRKPRHSYPRHVLLEGLEERHEIPDCKDVSSHAA